MRSISALIIVATSVSIASASGPEASVGKPLPSFSVKDIAGKTWSNKDLKGKTVILDFWATWCGPCKAASPVMQSLAKKYASKGLVVVAANGFDSPAKVKEYVSEHKYSMPFAVGAQDLQKKLGVTNLPAIFIIDKSGKVSSVTTSWTAGDDAKFEKKLTSVLK